MTLNEILELVGPLDESAGETPGTTQLARARRKSP
jgi:hypothetical protein